MKIAIACENDMVAQHFGHCSTFNIFDVNDGKIVENKLIDNPGHKPGFLPVYLNDMGVQVIISGGMGQGAVEICKQKDIKVITGVTGTVKEVIGQYIAGKLVSDGSVCNRHEHRNECRK